MPQISVLLPAAVTLQPYRQGQFSSLCGLYSVLNGIQLVLWPHHKLTRNQLKELFVCGIHHLDRSRTLAFALDRGMEEDVWLDLGRRLIKEASTVTGLAISRRFILRRRSKLTRHSAIASIKQELRANRPVLVILWGDYDHVTAIVGYNRGRLILFDSSGFKWINESSFGLQHCSSSKRHQVTRRTVLALSLEEPW